jgi:hypothetical protein
MPALERIPIKDIDSLVIGMHRWATRVRGRRVGVFAIRGFSICLLAVRISLILVIRVVNHWFHVQECVVEVLGITRIRGIDGWDIRSWRDISE